MTNLRSFSLAASLMAATMLVSPSFAIDLGGAVGGTLDPTMGAGGRLGGINDRANGMIDRSQDRAAGAAGAIEVPDAPTADEVNSALEAAGYAEAGLETPAGSLSGSASGSADNPGGDIVPAVETPPTPDANAAIDRAQSAKDLAAARAAEAVPASTPVSGSASVDARGSVATGEPEAASAPASDDDEASPEGATFKPERSRGVDETAPRQY